MVVTGIVATTAATALPVAAYAQQRGIARKQIEIAADSGKFDAYLSALETGKGPGVIMCSDIFGIHQGMKDLCDDLAQRSCVVLAQNFFWRDPEDAGVLPLPAGFKRAVARSQRIDFPKSMDDLRRSIAEVKRHPNNNGKIAVFGFCFGGPYAWRSACDGLGIDAAVSFHGSYMSKFIKPADKPSGQVSLHYGDSDELAPPQELEAVKKVADATGSEFVIHPGAGHAYMFPNNPQYNAEAARTSWARALQIIDTLRT
jgi:carboxymethylenebutenolidase